MQSLWNFSVSEVCMHDSLIFGYIAQKITQIEWILMRNTSYVVFVKLFSFWGRHVCSTTLRSHFTENHTNWVNTVQRQQLCDLCESFQFLTLTDMTPWFSVTSHRKSLRLSEYWSAARVVRPLWNFSVSEVGMHDSLIFGYIAQKITRIEWILMRNNSYAVFVKQISFWGRHVCSSTLRSHYTENDSDWVNTDQKQHLCDLRETFQLLRSAVMTPWFLVTLHQKSVRLTQYCSETPVMWSLWNFSSLWSRQAWLPDFQLHCTENYSDWVNTDQKHLWCDCCESIQFLTLSHKCWFWPVIHSHRDIFSWLPSKFGVSDLQTSETEKLHKNHTSVDYDQYSLTLSGFQLTTLIN